jgi:hypothetical protein
MNSIDHTADVSKDWSAVLVRSRSRWHDFAARRDYEWDVIEALNQLATRKGGGGPAHGDAASYSWNPARRIRRMDRRRVRASRRLDQRHRATAARMRGPQAPPTELRDRRAPHRSGGASSPDRRSHKRVPVDGSLWVWMASPVSQSGRIRMNMINMDLVLDDAE